MTSHSKCNVALDLLISRGMMQRHGSRVIYVLLSMSFMEHLVTVNVLLQF
jgi:hypothetical protein